MKQKASPTNGRLQVQLSRPPTKECRTDVFWPMILEPGSLTAWGYHLARASGRVYPKPPGNKAVIIWQKSRGHEAAYRIDKVQEPGEQPTLVRTDPIPERETLIPSNNSIISSGPHLLTSPQQQSNFNMSF